MGTGVFGEAVYIRLPAKRRRLLYILTLQYILDLTVQNDVICDYAKLGMFSMDLKYGSRSLFCGLHPSGGDIRIRIITREAASKKGQKVRLLW
jgi:hypothetical protein